MTLTNVISKRTVFGKDAVLTGNASITGSVTAKTAIVTDNSSSDAVRITQTGSGNALLVEDSANPDSTPFVVKSDGRVGIGITDPQAPLNVASTIIIGRQTTSSEGGEIRFSKALDNSVSWFIDVLGSTSTPVLRIVEQTSSTTAVARFTFKAGGTINIPAIQTHANNAAAIAGGLVVNDVYKTSTGELRIVYTP